MPPLLQEQYPILVPQPGGSTRNRRRHLTIEVPPLVFTVQSRLGACAIAARASLGGNALAGCGGAVAVGEALDHDLAHALG